MVGLAASPAAPEVIPEVMVLSAALAESSAARQEQSASRGSAKAKGLRGVQEQAEALQICIRYEDLLGHSPPR
jgi:hypothetical protein